MNLALHCLAVNLITERFNNSLSLPCIVWQDGVRTFSLDLKSLFLKVLSAGGVSRTQRQRGALMLWAMCGMTLFAMFHVMTHDPQCGSDGRWLGHGRCLTEEKTKAGLLVRVFLRV